MAATVPLGTPRVQTVLARAVRLRCPRCGRDRLYARWFTMHERCGACGLRYEREQGYFVGAIYVNYALTVALGLGGVLLLDRLVGLSLRTQLAVAVPVMLLAPLVFFRHARSLWLAIGFLASGLDERGGRSAARAAGPRTHGAHPKRRPP
jgi:uncharacterized protein (DUF983 family)